MDLDDRWGLVKHHVMKLDFSELKNREILEVVVNFQCFRFVHAANKMKTKCSNNPFAYCLIYE